jgi:hypothetical protein
MMSQPVWRLFACIGDVNWIEEGGLFVMVDDAEHYSAEAEYLDVFENERAVDEDCKLDYTVYRFVLEKCSYIDGILSDSSYHPDHPAWFARPYNPKRPDDTTFLSLLADSAGITERELIWWFCSDDPIQRALAYRVVGEYHGWQNLDSYPLGPHHFARQDVLDRYEKSMARLRLRELHKVPVHMPDSICIDWLIDNGMEVVADKLRSL